MGGACGLIGPNAGKLTRVVYPTPVMLKTLLKGSQGGAWPSTARAVRCPVKSGNERDPLKYLPAIGMPSRAQYFDSDC